uniref:Ycf34 n=1 Tax=Apoglossum ruscifolium TaxID=167976 RepID=A0A4D6WLG4_9FLOR|nr:hypothetical protein [Apoglossum ruscifolium]
MCICVNCRHINQCKIYTFIEKQHYSNNTEYKKSKFAPTNTLIQVNINQKLNNTTIDWDLIECLSFVEKPGYWVN